MILRNIIVADHARTLGRSAEPERVERPAIAALLEPLPSLTGDVGANFDYGPPSPPSSRITFEQVAAWLAVQDGDTRVACASLLAEELTLVHEQARLKGHEAGAAQAKAEVAQEASRVLTTLSAVADAADTAFNQESAALAESCADVVAEVFTKIAGSMLATREAIVGTVTTVLSRVKEDREVTIRISAEDLPVLQMEEQRLAHLLGRRKFALVADARITVGGCIVETSLGSLDGRLDVQLREMCETLRSAKAAMREPA
jgi:flagellar assembly protein FliH